MAGFDPHKALELLKSPPGGSTIIGLRDRLSAIRNLPETLRHRELGPNASEAVDVYRARHWEKAASFLKSTPPAIETLCRATPACQHLEYSWGTKRPPGAFGLGVLGTGRPALSLSSAACGLLGALGGSQPLILACAAVYTLAAVSAGHDRVSPISAKERLRFCNLACADFAGAGRLFART